MASRPSAIATKSVQQPTRVENLKHTSPYVRRLTGDWGVQLRRNYERARQVILTKVQGRLEDVHTVPQKVGINRLAMIKLFLYLWRTANWGKFNCFKPAISISDQCTAFSGPAFIRCHQVARCSIIRRPAGLRDSECQPRIAIWLSWKPVAVLHVKLGGLDHFCVRYDV